MPAIHAAGIPAIAHASDARRGGRVGPLAGGGDAGGDQQADADAQDGLRGGQDREATAPRR